MICLVNSDNERDSIILTRYLSAVEMLKLSAGVLCVLSGAHSIFALAVEFHLIVWSWPLQGVSGSICLIGQFVFSKMRLSNNRSVMPLDVLGSTRATMKP
jgi:hypothetical protein